MKKQILLYCVNTNIIALSVYANTMEGKMNGYVSADVMAKRWNISVRQVQLLCQSGKIEGISKFGNAWAIPENTLKPTRSGKCKPGRKPKYKI